MKRRKFLSGVGLASAGGALAVGSGAFGSVEADRNVSVAVENDWNAYLSLTPTASDFSTMSGESTLKFIFDGNVSPPGGTNEDTGDGVSANAVYEFPELFKVENQGQETVVVFGQGSIEQNIRTDVITAGRGEGLSSNNPSDKILAPGGDQLFGIKLTIGDINTPTTVNTKVKITGATEESERFPDTI